MVLAGGPSWVVSLLGLEKQAEGQSDMDEAVRHDDAQRRYRAWLDMVAFHVG